MFEAFTKTARRALAIANQQTHVLGGYIVADVELLLGIVEGGRGLGYHALEELRVDLGSLRRELRSQPRLPADGFEFGRLPRTEECKLALAAAMAISHEAGEKLVDTGHVLLGILRYPDHSSSRVLSRHAVSFDGARDLITAERSVSTNSEE